MGAGLDIIIIGAGPSGLVAALTLAQEGQRVAIYDALPKGRNGSRATGIHAHTLEVTLAVSLVSFKPVNAAIATSYTGIRRSTNLNGDQGARRSQL